MSETKIQSLEQIEEKVESDTDNENDFSKNKKSKIENNKQNIKNNAIVFNQSNQNFAKFTQMAENNNNNQSSFSDQSVSKEENSDEKDISIITREMKKKKISSNKNVSVENKFNSDFIKNNTKINDNKNFNHSDSYQDENDISRANNYGNENFNILEREEQIRKLSFFDINQFLDLDIDDELKSLVVIMKKFEVDKSIISLDTKIKPFIPNFVPSIGEVDAFIKINRPDIKVEELGLNFIDEPTMNGIDPSVFSLELSYKMKNKIPEKLVIKSIENADKNPKQISNWIENLENLHNETSNKNFFYTKPMPEIELLMQVWNNYISSK